MNERASCQSPVSTPVRTRPHLLHIGIIAAALAGCVDSHDAPPTGIPVPTVENSCAIRCDRTTMRESGGIAGSVSCAKGWSPTCQCVDHTKPMAGCERLPPPPPR
jgi:hypothetical protein